MPAYRVMDSKGKILPNAKEPNVSITSTICDWIWENVYSSHIRFCSFRDPQKSQGMVYRFETFRNNKRIVVLQSLNDSHLSVIPNKFYESPKLKHWMCELCTFSQIRSHILMILSG